MKTFKEFRNLKEAAKCSKCGCDPMNPKEGCDCSHKEMKEEPMDGVAAGSLEGDKHMCATKIFKEGLGEGTPVHGEHAIPDEAGNISWYKVMFEHGIETVDVEEEGVEILMSEAHMNHKKKVKENVELDEVSNKLAKSYYNKAAKDIGRQAGNAQASRHFAADSKRKAGSSYQSSSLGVRKTTDDDKKQHSDSADSATASAKNAERKIKNRATGMSRAADRMKEEVEEIEEVSKKTLGSYIKKATASYGTRERIGKDFERDSETGSAKSRNSAGRLAREYRAGAQKRKVGIEKATDRLVNKKKDD